MERFAIKLPRLLGAVRFGGDSCLFFAWPLCHMEIGKQMIGYDT
jgi:hypothetical protein